MLSIQKGLLSRRGAFYLRSFTVLCFCLFASTHQSSVAEPAQLHSIEFCKLNHDHSGHVIANLLPPIDMDAPDEPMDRGGMYIAAAGTVPAYNSNPGASKTIYLDFDGHTVSGTSWNFYNDNNDIVAPAYSTDSDTSTFSASELARIQEIWKRVSEDFDPFDVNVSTVDPGTAAFTAGGTALRVLISTNVDSATSNKWYGDYGGVAYLNSWNWSSDTPVWVFENNLGNGNEKYVAEAISHEVGHGLNLSHDGTSTQGYYGGHGSGNTGWAPIMGVGYSKRVSQWSKGEYSDANNTEDDLARIALKLPYRGDDHGNSNGAATALTPSSGAISGSGRITTRTDVDVFSFETGPGTVVIAIDPFEAADGKANLDIYARLYNSGGGLVASSNPVGDLDADFNLTLTSGTYYLHIEGTGVGTASTGYTDYASLGSYTLSGTVQEVDADGDGVPGTSDCNDANPNVWTNVAFADPDSDGVRTDSTPVTTSCFGNTPPSGFTLSTNGPDNCPSTANAGQADLDNDNIGDVCDSNIDGDPEDNGSDCAPNDGSRWTTVGYPDGDGDNVRNSTSPTTLSCFGSTPPAGYTAYTNGPDNCPTVANPSQDNHDSDSQGDACDADDDNDGLLDTEENGSACPSQFDPDSDDDNINDKDDPDPCEADELPLGRKICSEWNGFLGDPDLSNGMYNIMEVRRKGTASAAPPINVTATLYTIAGAAAGTTVFTLNTGQKVDLLVHEMTGFSYQSYGLVCVEHDGSDGEVDGAMIHYNARNAGYDFAIAMPFTAGKIGRQVVPFNMYHPGLAALSDADTSDPDDAGVPVENERIANWIQASYFPVSGSSDVFYGDLYLCDSDGNVLLDDNNVQAKFNVALSPGQRQDFNAHQFGQQYGLALLVPKAGSEAIPIALGNHRYFYRKSFTRNTFDTAVRLDSVKGGTKPIVVPLDARSGTQSIVEVLNPNDTPSSALVTVYSQNGEYRGQVSLSTSALPGRGSFHVLAGDLLNPGERGVAAVQTLSGSIAVVQMEYRRDAGGLLEVASATIGRKANGVTMNGDYNTFISQSSEALFINTTGTAQVVSYDILGLSGNALYSGVSVTVPANGFVVLPFNDYVATDTYGQVLLNVPADSNGFGTVIGIVQRERPSDWVLSLPIRQ